jgi:MoaA/NifB/PqqE/SkfB family radical SAM enzyme
MSLSRAQKKYFTLQITEECLRMCSHCFVDANSEGKSVEFSDLESSVAQIAQLVHERPEKFEDYVALTGGDILFYESHGFNLGDVIDLIHSHDLEVTYATRGFTNKEKETNALAYRNFNEIQKRHSNSGYKPTITLSFDTYAYDGNIDLSKEMAINVIRELIDSNIDYNIRTVMSLESAYDTYVSVLELMDQIRFSPITNLTEQSTIFHEDTNEETVRRFESNLLIEFYRNFKSAPQITFRDGYGKTIDVSFYDIIKDGRGNYLDETPLLPASNCSVSQSNNSEFVIRYDQGIVPCCNNDFSKLPVLGNLKDNTLKEILSNYYEYSLGVFKMQQDVRTVLKGEDICTVCPRILAEYF